MFSPLYGRLEGKIPDEGSSRLQVLRFRSPIITGQPGSAGTCGTRTLSSQTERAKICPSCHYVTYPRISPAIIVLVKKDDTILLVRGKRAPAGRFSLVAGFVEPGETIERAVQREVKEEAGIEIHDIRYLASEPWPFPNSLMIGFVADYTRGTLTPDGVEIESAGWFTRDSSRTFP